MASTETPEVLELNYVVRAERKEIRARRAYKWRARNSPTGPGATDGEAGVDAGAQEPPENVVEGVPAPTPPKRQDAAKALALDRILEELEDSRQEFLQAHSEPKAASGAASAKLPVPPLDPDEAAHYGLTGLALSGGGVRSATFCLGAVQALAKWDAFSKFDYVSSVSGGGFIGSCLSSLYADGSTAFPFAHKPGVPEGEPMRHLRNYSSYLVPRGLVDYLKAPGLLLRGVLVNFTVILPYVLIAAIATVCVAGQRIRDAAFAGVASVESIFGGPAERLMWSESFSVTIWALWFGFAALLLFPVAQTLGAQLGWSTWGKRNFGNGLLSAFVASFIAIAAIEVQPIAVYYTVRVSEFLDRTDYWDLDVVVGTITAVAGAVATVSGKVAPQVNRLAGKFALVAIGLLGPLVLWLVYLMVTRWAICGPPDWLGGMLVELSLLQPATSFKLCYTPLSDLNPSEVTGLLRYVFAGIALLIFLYAYLFFNANRNSLHTFYRDRLSRAYLFKRGHTEFAGTRAWFGPAEPVTHNDTQPLQELCGQVRARRRLFIWQIFKWLSKISPVGTESYPFVAPYHLINAAVNVRRTGANLREEGDEPEDEAERETDTHGRGADFFLFSPLFVGSKVTSFCRTEHMSEVDRHVDLGTAMAISGAAAAPNMGTSTVRPLTFILTLLNVRLGYWLPNPLDVHRRFLPTPDGDANAAEGETNRAPANPVMAVKRWFGRAEGRFKRVWRSVRNKARKWAMKALYIGRLSWRVGPLYLLLEMFGLLNQNWPFINVSDGGHIENLGLYPLLQRRCRLIVAIDGERDPAIENKGHKFSALAAAIRYARIDHGIDIDIDLKKIGAENGNHFAVGKITYGDDFPHGWLVYVKASLTGDENPYISEYKLQKPDFPHETTGDQFFDETQFECYRALGYHAVEDFLERSGGNISGDPGLKQLFPPDPPRAPAPAKPKPAPGAAKRKRARKTKPPKAAKKTPAPEAT